MWEIALSLSLAAPGRKGLPPLLFLTDPERTPDPEGVAAQLPAGAGVVFRAFGAADAVDRGQRLAAIARDRGLTLLVGADEALATACGADGLHLPERAIAELPALRAKHPGWLFTAAAHSAEALQAAAQAGADAALLSAVFPSQSPSAGPPLGQRRFAALVRQAGLPVYALGGVNTKTAPRLLATGAVGLAVVSGI
ncbi:thiamine-phosphate pyrophosphorylase [Caulobacter ginsengisoli]|uniref:Thiamine-phosphate pyrophosphorylase n=1 Tax=Caulobacter ginsengisoli TaxID=400775 RepID=A0ABU0ITI6_9CAUL|nr:thiamine phosphate synthase [Caulobacter ginsengisoli]MDQ0465323.1 thiamine-phosphate pyrophosphorylase [Caulobacter ginsengisoli]